MNIQIIGKNNRTPKTFIKINSGIKDKYIAEKISLISRKSNPITLVFGLTGKLDKFWD